MKRILILSLLFMMILPVMGHAETIILRSGKEIKGKILEQYEDYIRVEVDGNPVNYYRFQVERIEKDPVPGAILGQLKEPLVITDEKKELIKRFLEANGTRENISLIFSDVVNRAPEQNRTQLKAVLQSDAVIDRLVPIYAEVFNEEELKELITFYVSPTGHKNLKMTPKIMEKVLQEAAKYFDDISSQLPPAPSQKMQGDPKAGSMVPDLPTPSPGT